MAWTVILFIVGLALLVKGGDLFVDGAVGIAKRFHIPDIIIGATVVSIGTTLPEVMVSAASALGGHGDMAYGNAVGSVICNTTLICALTAAFRPCEIDRKSLRLPVVFFFIAAVFYTAVSVIVGEFGRLTGIILLVIFVLYLFISVRSAFGEMDENRNEEPAEAESTKSDTIKNIIMLIIGAAAIAFGADLLVDNGTLIAVALGVPETVIALTFIALGTSLPELVTAITSLIKGHSSLSLGNVIGANLFDLVFVTGTAATLSPFTVPQSKAVGGVNAAFVIDLPFMLVSMAVLTLPALFAGRLRRWQGIILLGMYCAFCILQFV